MPSTTYIFRRIEKKYFLTLAQYRALLSLIGAYLIPDAYGKSTVCSLYLDTPDFRLIRASIDAVAYKEKLRVRTYGAPSNASRAFLEIKKKYKGVVYKRRVSMTFAQVLEYIRSGKIPNDSQIMREIEYAMRIYDRPTPAMFLFYEREAYFVKELPAVRLTFDTNVRYRREGLEAGMGTEGKPVQSCDSVLMEIKTDGAMPLWLSAALDRCCIYPTKFSKYGTAYRDYCTSEPQKNLMINEGAQVYV